MIKIATTPASVNEIGEQAMIILSHYYIPNHVNFMQDAAANLWIEHLQGYPVWAIKRAISWWVGKDNPKRSNRPLPGDIAKKCEEEIVHISFVRDRVHLWNLYQGKYPVFLEQD